MSNKLVRNSTNEAIISYVMQLHSIKLASITSNADIVLTARKAKSYETTLPLASEM